MTGKPAKESPPRAPDGARMAAATVLALLLIAAGGAAFYSSQERLALSAVENQLSAVAKLKIGQIVGWERDRLADCRALVDDPYLGASAEDYAVLGDAASLRYLRTRLGSVERREDYSDILLVDAEGKILLSLAGSEGQLDPPSLAVLETALRRDAPGMTDLYRARDGRISIDAIAPIHPRARIARGIFALVLRSDPDTFLYPLIQSWPVPSASAETLLVRKDGDSVLFLNELRHRPGPPLSLRISMARTDLPAVMAASGIVGVRRGRDYRGVPVLAALAPVPGTSWFIVSKIDIAEAKAPWHSSARLIVALFAVFAAAALALAAFFWQRRRLARYRELYAAEQAKTRAEEQLRELNAELESRVSARTKELEAANAELEAFAYNVSHDLRSPLRAIDGYGSVLEEEDASHLSEAGEEALGRIRSSTRHMGRLIDDLLEFARVGRIELDRERVDMDALVESALDELLPAYGFDGRAPGARARIELSVARLESASGDALLLRQVWVNLIDNALKFSSGRERPKVEVACEKLSSGVRYYVRDNGAGFDMRYKAKLFRVFQRLHGAREFGGTGVGLAIVQRVVERHGGSVDAAGAVGEGATVSFTLPSGED
ncbi:MAG TPA: ATP-binding protein [Rectinemataceae bacterium]|nr:ATP-binding protein [Rectinemataceae bacterium]